MVTAALGRHQGAAGGAAGAGWCLTVECLALDDNARTCSDKSVRYVGRCQGASGVAREQAGLLLLNKRMSRWKQR